MHEHTSIFSRPAAHLDASATRFATITTALCVLALMSGCASTKVSNQRREATGPIPRPDMIRVYDFAASPAGVPAESALHSQFEVGSSPQTPEQQALGKALGAEIAKQLVAKIQDMGMPAARGTDTTTLNTNDIVIHGYLVSAESGSGAKRVVFGFGSGDSKLETVAEGFQATPTGLRRLGSGTVDSSGGKTPGGVVGVAAMVATGSPVGLIVGGGMKAYSELSGRDKIQGRAKATADEIAKLLKRRFQEEGWVQ